MRVAGVVLVIAGTIAICALAIHAAHVAAAKARAAAAAPAADADAGELDLDLDDHGFPLSVSSSVLALMATPGTAAGATPPPQ